MDYSNYCVICAHIRNLLKKGKIESISSSIVSKPKYEVICTILVWVTESKVIDISFFEGGKLMCTALEKVHKIDYFEDPNEVIKWIDDIVE